MDYAREQYNIKIHMNMSNFNLSRLAQRLGNNVFGKKEEYHLKFNLEADGKWYIDFPGWPFAHHNLMMVRGADELCNHLSVETKGKKSTNINVIPSEQEESHPGYAVLVRQTSSLTGGSTYQVNGLPGFERNIWLCPVTLFVLGEYPQFIYIKQDI